MGGRATRKIHFHLRLMPYEWQTPSGNWPGNSKMICKPMDRWVTISPWSVVDPPLTNTSYGSTYPSPKVQALVPAACDHPETIRWKLLAEAWKLGVCCRYVYTWLYSTEDPLILPSFTIHGYWCQFINVFLHKTRGNMIYIQEYLWLENLLIHDPSLLTPPSGSELCPLSGFSHHTMLHVTIFPRCPLLDNTTDM